MKKTSRRNFGKQLTGAIAALPVASLANRGIAQGQANPKKSSNASDQIAPKEREHDTPPPLFIVSGSLILEAKTDKTNWMPTPMPGNRRGYRLPTKDYNNNLPTSPIFVAHIKIIDGSGEIVYRFDNTSKTIPVHVTCLMNGDPNENFHLSVDDKEFLIDVPDKRKINRKPGEPEMNGKRRRVKYLDDQDNDSQSITTVQVIKGSKTLFQIDRSDLGRGAEEMKIMVWWEQ